MDCLWGHFRCVSDTTYINKLIIVFFLNRNIIILMIIMDHNGNIDHDAYTN